MVIKPRRKTITYRRGKAQEMRNELLHYRQFLDDRKARIQTMAILAAKLANLINLETDGEAREQVDAIWQAHLALVELAKKGETP